MQDFTDEAELWKGLRDQKGEAYRQLEVLVHGVCTPLFRRWGVPLSDLEALCEDVIVSIWKFSRRHCEQPKNLVVFLKWRARGVLSKEMRRKAAADGLFQVGLPTENPGDGPHPPDEAYSGEIRQAFLACREELPTEYRRVWVARSERGMSASEAAAALGISKALVALHLHRANEKLLECLRRKEVLEWP